MSRQYLNRLQWLLLYFYISKISCEGDKEQWSKPEQSLSAQNNDWIPVPGKCATCRPNRDLDSQSTNDQIGRVLSPPRHPSVAPSPQPPSAVAPLPPQQVQFPTNKQPRILQFGPGYPHFNSPFTDTKQYQPPSTKLFAQEPQKSFYQFENNGFARQPFSLPPQQLIPQSQTIPQQPAQRLPPAEPYPFTLPLKTPDNAITNESYQPKIRFPDSELPNVIPNNKITSQNNEEIQLLYVPVETLQRGRKTMKDLFNQNQFQSLPPPPPPPPPPNFSVPQFNFQYPQVPKPVEGQFYFSNFPSPNNYLQYNALQQAPPVRPEQAYMNISKNFLQPYFTINGVYNPIAQVPQAQPLPSKQTDLQYFNVIQPTVYNQYKGPEQLFKSVPNVPRPAQPIGSYVPNTISTFNDVYVPTTPEVTKLAEYTTKIPPPGQNPDFTYQFVTTNPQLSVSQNEQQFAKENKIPSFKGFTQTPASLKTASLKGQGIEEQASSYPVPHQPPLSFYMEKLHNPKINDVLYLLKDSKTIPVLDTVETETPQVFVGPSELPPPKGYVKFELPYLSSLDYSRIERMIDRLPFFVAPLNFKPPPGYSKIPFPAPHIGSVVLSNSTTFQESLQSLHDKPFDQKFKAPTHRPFSASPELSTITPQLTSQINSLLDSSSPITSELTSFKNSVPPATAPAQAPITYQHEENTKKPMSKFRPQTSSISTSSSSYTTSAVNNGNTDPPKRPINNRQRKPIYRGYPTTEPTTQSTTTEATQQFSSESPKEIIDFTTQEKYNVNNGNENIDPFSSNPPIVETTFQAPTTSTQSIDSTFKKTYDFSNFFTRFQPNEMPRNSPEKQYHFNQFDPRVTQQQIQNNAFETPKLTNFNDFSAGTSSNIDNINNQNDPYYSSQPTVDVKSEPLPNQLNNNEPQTTSQPNFNFNNVKPLSQYNPFIKEDNVTETSSTKPTSQSNQQTNEFNFWNQNQFYKINPNAVDYFSSTANYQPEPVSETEASWPKSTSTEPDHIFESQKFDSSREFSSSTEYLEPSTTSTSRPRHKQRIHPNRYHQVKQTTEKEITTEQVSTSSLDSTQEPSTHIDSVSQPTENQEPSTRGDIKHRRRRPNRPHQITNAATPTTTEIYSSTSRNYRTRTTRYPNGVAANDRHRARRPTTSTSSESTYTFNSDWSSNNNFAPSAASTNDISYSDNHPRTNSQDENNNDSKFSSSYWAKAIASETTTPNFENTFHKSGSIDGNTESSWSSVKQNTPVDEYSIYQSSSQKVVENSVENKTESVVERKDDVTHLYRRPVKITTQEDISSTPLTSEIIPLVSEEHENFQSEKEYEKEKFLTKDDADSQKKAYDPQEDKKATGRRRGTWVRRIRVKRPQDVFETAESQNLGRITDNSLKTSNSKVFSKTEEIDGKIKSNTAASTPEDYATTLEVITEKLSEKTEPVRNVLTYTTTVSSFSDITDKKSEEDNNEEYANLQNNFAQMLSDFLNSNDRSSKTVNNLERKNVSTDNSISYVLGLGNGDSTDSIISNSSFQGQSVISPTENPTSHDDDDVITITNSPAASTELIDHSTTTEESADTVEPNKALVTSTTTEISLETEICYRGKCVKTKKSKASDLLPVE